MVEKLIAERTRDVNLNIAVSDEPGEAEFPLDYAGFGTLNNDFLEFVDSFGTIKKNHGYGKVKVDALRNITKQYVPSGQDIHFCKIDVEGYEEKCLNGLDWDAARPWIFCLENTLESFGGTNRTDLHWEHILREYGYAPALIDLNNKYYVANEHRELAEELLPRWYLFQLYDCYPVTHAISTNGLQPENMYYWNPQAGDSARSAD